MSRATVATVRWTRVFLGQADQVSRARAELDRHLTACRFTRTDDAVLVLSEFASNAVLHSASAGASFTVRTELFPAYLWIEVEDLGGEWHLKLPKDRMHGLGLVEMLTAPDGWGVDGGEAGHVVWHGWSWSSERRTGGAVVHGVVRRLRPDRGGRRNHRGSEGREHSRVHRLNVKRDRVADRELPGGGQTTGGHDPFMVEVD